MRRQVEFIDQREHNELERERDLGLDRRGRLRGSCVAGELGGNRWIDGVQRGGERAQVCACSAPCRRALPVIDRARFQATAEGRGQVLLTIAGLGGHQSETAPQAGRWFNTAINVVWTTLQAGPPTGALRRTLPKSETCVLASGYAVPNGAEGMLSARASGVLQRHWRDGS